VVTLVPLCVSVSGYDSFRLPKEIVFRGGAILLAALLALRLIALYTPPLRPPALSRRLVLISVTVLWVALTALTATNRALATEALITVLCAVVFFVAVSISAPRRLTLAAVVVLAPAAINSMIFLLQKYAGVGIFVDIKAAGGREMANVALQGNPDEVASYLVAPAIAALALAVVERGPRRRLYATAALFLALTLISTERQTATIAYGVAALTLVALVRSRKLTFAFLTFLGVMLISVAVVPRISNRFRTTLALVRSGEYDSAVTGRISSFVSATEMFLDHPLLGVGPGCFKYNYFEYSLRAQQRCAKQLSLSQTRGVNFGETHSDHLQILAETGAPGYAIFLAILIAVAARSVRASQTDDPEPTQRFVLLASAPIAVSFFVLAAAQFPLELASPRLVTIYLIALCERWNRVS